MYKIEANTNLDYINVRFRQSDEDKDNKVLALNKQNNNNKKNKTQDVFVKYECPRNDHFLKLRPRYLTLTLVPKENVLP